MVQKEEDHLMKEIKMLVIGAVLTLSGAIMMTSEDVAVVGIVIGIIGLLFLLASLLTKSKLASYYREDSGAEQDSGEDEK